MDEQKAKKIARKRKRERNGDAFGQHKQAKLDVGKTSKHGEADAIEECNAAIDPWTPTEEEVEAWGRKVVELTARVEENARRASAEAEVDASTQPPPNKRRRMGDNDSTTNATRFVPPGRDRTGTNAVSSYRKSLPPLLAAAADGKCNEILSLLEEQTQNLSLSNAEKNNHIRKLLDQQDRNGSIAEHWAAGGGHLKCLQLLHRYRDMVSASDSIEEKSHDDDDVSATTSNRRQRRRDGRTSLHFACKNGQVDVIAYLLEERSRVARFDVDIATGDGTTPLHLACFSGHFSTIKLLIERYGADIQRKNDWGCGVAHWIAMSVNPAQEEVVVQICQYLRTEHNICFAERQAQGHSAVHKAAQKKNRGIIEWCHKCMNSVEKEEAGKSDDGGNKPSDIWTSAGGDAEFAEWMQSNGW